MGSSSIIPKPDQRAPAERLVEIADAMFDRATKLDSIKLEKPNEEAAAAIRETRDEAYRGVIEIWRVVLDVLPTSGLDQPQKHALEIDGHKVISRCFHCLGDLEQARCSITSAIDLGYSDGFISLGAISLDLKDYDAAENAFKSALAKNVQSMRAHAGLGELYFILGTNAVKANPDDTAYFFKAEEEFMAAGKERFTESFERAMDLFETIGWKDKALAIGEYAAQFYSAHRLKYGDRLRALDIRLRKMAGDQRHDRFIAGVGRRLGDLVGGKARDPKWK